jgi:hypothetical protein
LPEVSASEPKQKNHLTLKIWWRDKSNGQRCWLQKSDHLELAPPLHPLFSAYVFLRAMLSKLPALLRDAYSRRNKVAGVPIVAASTDDSIASLFFSLLEQQLH